MKSLYLASLALVLVVSGCSSERPELNGFEHVALIKGCHYLDELFWDFETSDDDNNLYVNINGARDLLIGFSDFQSREDTSEIRSLWERLDKIDFESAIVKVYDTYREQDIYVRGPGYKNIRNPLRKLRFDCNIAIQNYITHRDLK